MTSNLRHKRFGHLFVEAATKKHDDGGVVWRCRCDCGNECEASTLQLTRGGVRCCGKLSCTVGERPEGDLVGRRVGRLVVAETVVVGADDITYRCNCDCGNAVFMATYSGLVSGKVRDCGCIDLGNARYDLVGQRFGQLYVVEPTAKRSGKCVVWLCQCDCGRTCEASTAQLRSGTKSSCGCLRWGNITGQRFGKLVAIEPTEKRARNSIVWRCKCDCGSECEASLNQLMRGGKKSCGCGQAEHRGEILAGQRFGRLVCVRDTGKRKSGSVVWECQCDCGNTCEALAKALKSGAKRSCGCLRGNARGYFKGEDLAGRRFGQLEAIAATDERQRGSVVWRCKCSCGNLRDVSAATLKLGRVTSCGQCSG